MVKLESLGSNSCHGCQRSVAFSAIRSVEMFQFMQDRDHPQAQSKQLEPPADTKTRDLAVFDGDDGYVF